MIGLQQLVGEGASQGVACFASEQARNTNNVNKKPTRHEKQPRHNSMNENDRRRIQQQRCLPPFKIWWQSDWFQGYHFS
jgi:hypothetical protein